MDIHENLSPTLPYHSLLSGDPLHRIQYLRRVGQCTSLLNGPHICPKSSSSVQHVLFILLGWFVWQVAIQLLLRGVLLPQLV